MTVEWRGPFWLKPFLAKSNDTIFHRVTSVQLNSRKVPEALLKFQYLESVTLENCELSRDQLRRLNRRGSIKWLALYKYHLADDTEIQLADGPHAQPTPAAEQNRAANWAQPCLAGLQAVAFVCPTNLAPDEKP